MLTVNTLEPCQHMSSVARVVIRFLKNVVQCRKLMYLQLARKGIAMRCDCSVCLPRLVVHLHLRKLQRHDRLAGVARVAVATSNYSPRTQRIAPLLTTIHSRNEIPALAHCWRMNCRSAASLLRDNSYGRTLARITEEAMSAVLHKPMR